LWLQGHTARASLLCSVGKIFHCVHYLSAAPRNWLEHTLHHGKSQPWRYTFWAHTVGLYWRILIWTR